MFFEHADCLVGICKDVQRFIYIDYYISYYYLSIISLSSKILTLDLGKYDANKQSTKSLNEKIEESSPASQYIRSNHDEDIENDEEEVLEEKREVTGKRKMVPVKTSRRSQSVINKSVTKQIYGETIIEGNESENSSG